MRRFFKPQTVKALGLGIGLASCCIGLANSKKSLTNKEIRPRDRFTDPLLTETSQEASDHLSKICEQVSQTNDARGLDLSVPSHMIIWNHLINKYYKMNYSGANFSVEPHSMQSLVNMDFLRAHFDECNFTNANLSNTKEYHNRGFFNCNLSRAKFQHTTMDQSTIAGCDATNADFSRLLVSRELDIKHTDLSGAHFNNAFLASTTIFMSNLAGTDFQNARAHYLKIINPRDFKGSNFKGLETNFLRATKDVDFNEAVSWDHVVISDLTLNLDVSPRQARTLAEGGAVWGPDAQTDRHLSFRERREIARQQLKFAGIWNRNIFTRVYDKFYE